MADDKADNIPTLDSIVELGDAETDTDNIRIIADNKALDDVYDEEFNKLFEPATDSHDHGHHEASDSDLDDDLIDRLRDEQKDVAPADHAGKVEDQDNIAPSRENAAADDLADIHLTASPEPDKNDGEDIGDDEDMWIQDWQEESREAGMIQAADADISDDIMAADEGRQPASEIQAVVTDDVADDELVVDVTTDSPPEVAGMSAKLAQVDDIPELANEIVRQIMPEIEWKLRTRIREILEQRLSDSE